MGLSLFSQFMKQCFSQRFLSASQTAIWKSRVPSKASFLLWLLTLKKVLIVDKLQARGLQLANRCSLCRDSKESSNHLFLYCCRAWSVWSFFLCRLRRQWVVPWSMEQMLLVQDKEVLIDLSPTGRFLWRCCPAIICWSLWSECNIQVFEGGGSKTTRFPIKPCPSCSAGQLISSIRCPIMISYSGGMPL